MPKYKIKMPHDDEGGITEEILRKRIKNQESGAYIPQAFVTFAVSVGAFSFGNILGWGGPALHHLSELEFDRNQTDWDFGWIVSMAPLGAAIGIFPCSFLTYRIGPRYTIITQAPFLLLSWFLMAYVSTYRIYCGAHFMSAFFSVAYIHAGESLLIDTVQRKHLKLFYAYFRSSMILGVLSMNFCSAFCNRLQLCIICASLTVICCVIIWVVHDSPVYLIRKHKDKAEKSLIFYTGKSSVTPELLVLNQYIAFLNFNESNRMTMINTSVVKKSTQICIILQCFKIMTGYYAFVLDSVKIFTSTESVISPYADNVIFGVVLVLSRFIGNVTHLHAPFGVKKPMLISISLMFTMLSTIALISWADTHFNKHYLGYCILALICLFIVSYEIGMSVCPEFVLYDYTPYQVYDFLNKMLSILHWFLVFCMVSIYMMMQYYLGLGAAVSILAFIAFAGFIFICVWVPDTKGKTLMAIQMELGGNPVGNRGSRRHRIANPMEQYENVDYLQKVIEENEPSTTK